MLSAQEIIGSMEDAMSDEKGYTHPQFLADTAWLEEHLEDPSIRIVDAGVL